MSMRVRLITSQPQEEFVIGSSYLIADTVGASGLTSAVTNVEAFTLNDSADTDFAIDGGDNTKINVLADCWAIIGYQPEAGASGGFTELTTQVNTSPLLLPVTGYTFTELKATFTEWYPTVTTPPVHLPAGTVLGAQLTGTTASGNWDNFGGPCTFQVVRVS